MRRSCLRSRSIGQFLNRTHRICFTAPLQEDGLSDAPSVAVKKLDRPALNGSLAGMRCDEPARGGGVNGVAATFGAQEDPDGPPAYGRELKSPRIDPRETLRRRDD